MELKSLSASAALVFENCPARFKAEVVDRVPQATNSAAGLGTVCHQALQDWVEAGFWASRPVREDMERLYTAAYEQHFADLSRWDEGLSLCLRWMERTDWTDREVLSTELKETFDIKTSAGPLPVTYIWDRCDDMGGGEIDVIDYKSWMKPVKPDEMKDKIQVRVYALAAAIKYPKSKRIWVTLDQLRYEPVSVAFTRDENVATWKYLHRLAERAIASDGGEETLNADCRYCVRKLVCEAMKKHTAAGGPLGITDPLEAAQRRYELEGAKKAIDVALGDLDAVIMGYCEQEEILEFSAERVKAAITAAGRRVIDPARAAAVLGPVLAAEFPGGITIGVVDKLMKEKPTRLSQDQRQQLRSLIRKEFGAASVKVVAKDPVTASA